MISPPITVNNKHVEEVETFKLLGVTISERISFAPPPHVNNMVTSARQKILTLAAPAWYPFIRQSDTLQLKGAQGLALGIILPNAHSYAARLKTCNLTELCELLSNTCKLYADKVQMTQSHPCHYFIPPRQSKARRHSERLRDRSICSGNTKLSSSYSTH